MITDCEKSLCGPGKDVYICERKTEQTHILTIVIEFLNTAYSGDANIRVLSAGDTVGRMCNDVMRDILLLDKEEWPLLGLAGLYQVSLQQ